MAAKRGAFRRYIKLLRLYAHMDLIWLTQDTKYTIIVLLSDIISMFSAISSVLLLAVRFGGAGGLSEAETLFMLGFVGIGNGLFTMCFCNFNVANISRRIGRSQLDHMMIQPLPLSTQLAAEGFAPFTGGGKLICGIIVTLWAAARLDAPLVWYAYILMPLLWIIYIGIMLGASYLVSAAAFYHPVSCEEISSVMMDALGTLSRFPLGGINTALQCALVTILPAGLLGWFPALLILGKAALLPGLLLPMTVCAFICTAAALAFKKGLMHYVRVGSNRYRDIGHRN